MVVRSRAPSNCSPRPDSAARRSRAFPKRSSGQRRSRRRRKRPRARRSGPVAVTPPESERLPSPREKRATKTAQAAVAFLHDGAGGLGRGFALGRLPDRSCRSGPFARLGATTIIAVMAVAWLLIFSELAVWSEGRAFVGQAVSGPAASRPPARRGDRPRAGRGRRRAAPPSRGRLGAAPPSSPPRGSRSKPRWCGRGGGGGLAELEPIVIVALVVRVSSSSSSAARARATPPRRRTKGRSSRSLPPRSPRRSGAEAVEVQPTSSRSPSPSWRSAPAVHGRSSRAGRRRCRNRRRVSPNPNANWIPSPTSAPRPSHSQSRSRSRSFHRASGTSGSSSILSVSGPDDDHHEEWAALVVAARFARVDGTLPPSSTSWCANRSACCSPRTLPARKRRPHHEAGFRPARLAPCGRDAARSRSAWQTASATRARQGLPGPSSTSGGAREAAAGREPRRFYGRPTSCGHIVERTTMGFAHPVLPCGAKIYVGHGGKEVLTQVVARGDSWRSPVRAD